MEEFDEGYMSCRWCIENMKSYREMNKDTRMEQNKDYRERHRQEKQLYNSLVVHCDVCDCEVRKHFARHQTTNKHMDSLRLKEAD